MQVFVEADADVCTPRVLSRAEQSRAGNDLCTVTVAEAPTKAHKAICTLVEVPPAELLLRFFSPLLLTASSYVSNSVAACAPTTIPAASAAAPVAAAATAAAAAEGQCWQRIWQQAPAHAQRRSQASSAQQWYSLPLPAPVPALITL